jgi:rhamnogalacturonyl hydrolase YesR
MELYLSRYGLKEDAAFTRWVDVLVEYGVDLLVDDQPFALDRINHMREGLKAAVVASEYADAVRQLGLYVTEYDFGDFELSEETLQSRALVLIGNADLSTDAAPWRDGLGGRDDWVLLESMGAALSQHLHRYTFGFGDPDLWHVGRPVIAWFEERQDPLLWQDFLKACHGRLMTEYRVSLGHTDPVAALRNLLFAFEKTQDESYLAPVKYAVMNVYHTWPRIGGVPVHSIKRDRWIWNEVSAMYGGTAAHLGRLIGVDDLLEDAWRLVFRLSEWCQDEDGLYFHAGRLGEHAPVKWSRGMSWALLGLMDALEYTSAGTETHRLMGKILDRAFVGLKNVQCETGLWRNVLTNPLSLPETSGTCKMITVFARAVRMGWLDRKVVMPVLEKAWTGVKCMLYEGRLLNWCQGTALTLSELHYLRRPHISYQPYTALWAGLELLRARASAPNTPAGIAP